MQPVVFVGRRPKSPGDYQQGLLIFQPKSKVSPALNLYINYTNCCIFSWVALSKPSVSWYHQIFGLSLWCEWTTISFSNSKFLLLQKKATQCSSLPAPSLVGGLKASTHLKNISQNGNLPQIGVKKYLKPPPRIIHFVKKKNGSGCSIFRGKSSKWFIQFSGFPSFMFFPRFSTSQKQVEGALTIMETALLNGEDEFTSPKKKRNVTFT